MDLYLSKLIPLFIYPLGFALVLSILAMGILGISDGLARLFLFVAVTVLWGASTPIFADYLGLTLEGQYPPVAVEETPTADVIVVLGGAVAGAAPPRITVDLSAAADRVLHAARLYRAGKAPVVLISGGAIPLVGFGYSGGRIDTDAAGRVGCAGCIDHCGGRQPQYLRECRVYPAGVGGTRAAAGLVGDFRTAHATATGDLQVSRNRCRAGCNRFHRNL